MSGGAGRTPLNVCCFLLAEWLHSAPHSGSLWKHQRGHIAVKPRGGRGLHCKGKSAALGAPRRHLKRFLTFLSQHEEEVEAGGLALKHL